MFPLLKYIKFIQKKIVKPFVLFWNDFLPQITVLKMSGVKGKYCYICKEFSKQPSLKVHQKSHENEIKNLRKSDNMKDAVLSACKICDKHVKVTDMRKHTKKVHQLTITKYKSRYSQQYFDLVELVLHQCGICGELLLLDSDYIAQHLKSGGHANITHGNYNNLYIKLQGPQGPRNIKTQQNLSGFTSAPSTAIGEDESIIKRLNNCSNLVIRRNSDAQNSLEISEHSSRRTEKSSEMLQNKPCDNLPPARVANEPNPVCVASFREFLDTICVNGSSTLRFPALEALLGFDSDWPESIFQTVAGMTN